MIEEIKDFKTTPLECDRRTWIYSNGNSITFSEIEMDYMILLRILEGENK